MQFTGFMPETIDFLWELRMNNSREWMEQNRARYQEVLKAPFDAFAAALAERSGDFCGKGTRYAVSRINRDIRFSKDKSPYRACRWVTIFDEALRGTQWKEHPTFYFELLPEGYRHGLGLWHASPAYLAAYRKKIEADPAAFARIAKKIAKDPLFQQGGAVYQRIKNESLPDGVQEWYRRKGIHVFAEGGVEDILFSPELPEYLAEEWRRLKGLYAFLEGIAAE